MQVTSRCAASGTFFLVVTGLCTFTQAAPALIDCLVSTQSRVVAPPSPEYDAARAVPNLRINRFPLAIVYPNSTQAVRDVILCCLESNVTAVARGGGHSYEGYGVLDGGVTVDLSEDFTSYRLLDGSKASVGGGVRVGPLYYDAWQDGLAFPAGTCPGVGLAGQAMGGGWGVLARKYGLACDHILGVEVVDAEGNIITADDTQNPDLLWAVRGGGGGNFGIVTELTLQMVPAPQAAMVFDLHWPRTEAVLLANHWQHFAPYAPDELSCTMFMGDRPALTGMCLGSEQQCDALLRASGMLDVPGLEYTTYKYVPFIDALLQYANFTQKLNDSAPINLSLPPNVTVGLTSRLKVGGSKAKSLTVAEPLSLEAIETIHNATLTTTTGWVQFSAYGGAVNRVPANATAFSHRSLLFDIQYYVGWDDPSQELESQEWINALEADLVPLVNGGETHAYLNYIDAELPDWQSAYYGENFGRLQDIKAQYDPGNFFRGPQTIPLPATS